MSRPDRFEHASCRAHALTMSQQSNRLIGRSDTRLDVLDNPAPAASRKPPPTIPTTAAGATKPPTGLWNIRGQRHRCGITGGRQDLHPLEARASPTAM